MGKIAIVIASADGIMSLQTGVGIVVNFYFEAFPEICQNFLSPKTHLYALCPMVNADSSDFSNTAFDTVNFQCQKHNGKLIPLVNVSSGNSLNEIWKGTEDFSPAEVWDSCCLELYKEVSRLSRDYERILLILHDTLFIKVIKYIEKPTNIEVCWIPHSLGTLFQAPNQNERIKFEKENINDLLFKGHKIGYISSFTKHHLLKYYGVKSQDMVSFYSGIYFNSKKYIASHLLEGFLGSHGISKGKKIVFSWGRCSDQKGIDIIIEAYASLIEANNSLTENYHLILLCPTETSYKEYLEKTVALLDSLPTGSYTFIQTFQAHIQYEILSYDKTRIILLCSRYESFGLTSIEAAYFANNLSTIIYSPLPTFKEVLQNNPNAIELELLTPKCLRQTIIKEINKTDYQKPSLVQKEKMHRQFSFVNNYRNGLTELFFSHQITKIKN
jgi:glycosyltransferase involved in cell wall biosynthesis